MAYVHWAEATGRPGRAGQTSDIASYGHDCKNITKVRFTTNATNTSSAYGLGYQVVFDRIKAHFNGAAPGARHFNPHHVAHGALATIAGQTHGEAVFESVCRGGFAALSALGWE